MQFWLQFTAVHQAGRLQGRLVSTISPDLTRSTVTYDEAGRAVGRADLSVPGSVLRSASAAYDDAGNLISATVAW